MLLRIVRLEFHKHHIDDFLSIFHESKSKIEAFDGCKKVDLYRDSKEKNVFYTHSLWESEEKLDLYRNSDFFRSTWVATKKLFSAKPLAYSLVK
jgi:hypothetical protein